MAGGEWLDGAISGGDSLQPGTRNTRACNTDTDTDTDTDTSNTGTRHTGTPTGARNA